MRSHSGRGKPDSRAFTSTQRVDVLLQQLASNTGTTPPEDTPKKSSGRAEWEAQKAAQKAERQAAKQATSQSAKSTPDQPAPAPTAVEEVDQNVPTEGSRDSKKRKRKPRAVKHMAYYVMRGPILLQIVDLFRHSAEETLCFEIVRVKYNIDGKQVKRDGSDESRRILRISLISLSRLPGVDQTKLKISGRVAPLVAKDNSRPLYPGGKPFHEGAAVEILYDLEIRQGMISKIEGFELTTTDETSPADTDPYLPSDQRQKFGLAPPETSTEAPV